MKRYLTIIVCLLSVVISTAQKIFSHKAASRLFPMNDVVIYIDKQDYVLIEKAAILLQKDIEMVTGKKPELIYTLPVSANNIIMIGSWAKSNAIRELITTKKIDLTKIKNQWEGYVIQTVVKPFAGIKNALVITGSNIRGTAYGVFELSKQMGVSPWYWWADVPVMENRNLFVNKNLNISDAPKVKYRGIFINDEAPALGGWSKEKFGGFNHLFYEKVFELILRLKGNYLWPAMWGNAFYDDDSLNIKSADDYGIVIGTSHHEPLMRAHVEWKRYGEGSWNYDSNEVRLKQFWRRGMERATNEKIVSVGMRGDGDEPMTRETATALLERIVKDQRQIIEEVTGKPASETPQLWALYKEVQDYYDKGMRVPDDVTLLLCDDNWGNIRKLPGLNEKPRKGGYGIYYHFDYVGDPRNYKWLNTNNIARVWEQMHLAYDYNVKNIWIVNVGDIKPMEYPISFFLDYAWNPERIDANDLKSYSQQWAAAQFGDKYATEIADIITKYSNYNARRKPELLDADTYSIGNYSEAVSVTAEYNELKRRAEKINELIPAEYKDAYFQLVLHPVKACSNLLELYTTVAMNRFFASKKLIIANHLADSAKELFTNDSLISLQYHTTANGKWNHMMDQTHIGYTYWQQPPYNTMPEVKYVPGDSALERIVQPHPQIKTAKKQVPENKKGNFFYEKDGYVSIGASHFTKAINDKKIFWKIIPGIGKTGSGITTFPVTRKPSINNPVLEYELYTYDRGEIKINSYFSPTLNFLNNDGLKYAIAIDDEQPQEISINKDGNDKQVWEKWVADNIIIKTTTHKSEKPGKHVIKYSVSDPGIILQKIVVDFGGEKESYLGPPETKSK